jgi:ribosomal protein S18 acetylase RimI-like enzyme
MTIQPYTQYNAAEILPLYESVGWVFYYKHPETVEKAYANSLCTLAAYEDGKPVGVIRAVGDGQTILFIQDLLVFPEYQRRGIGTGLMKAMLERYAHVYQIELATDNTEKTVAFYKSFGFHNLSDIGCCGFMKNGTV